MRICLTRGENKESLVYYGYAVVAKATTYSCFAPELINLLGSVATHKLNFKVRYRFAHPLSLRLRLIRILSHSPILKAYPFNKFDTMAH